MNVEQEAKSLLDKAGFKRPPGASYAYDAADLSVQLVALSDIEPPQRAKGVIALDPGRADRIICGMIDGEEMPPIGVNVPENADGKYRYALYGGFHRYYLSVAAGFSHIPVEVVDAATIKAMLKGER